jgi:hypothetical protein
LADLRFRTPRADRAHNYLYVRLNNCGETSVRDAADLLHELRGRRNVADYDVRPPFPFPEAATAVTNAAVVIKTLDTLTPAERIRITDAMKKYEQQIGDVTWHP